MSHPEPMIDVDFDVDVDAILEKFEQMELNKEIKSFILEISLLINQFEVSSLKINTLEKGPEDYVECLGHITRGLRTIRGGSNLHNFEKVIPIVEHLEKLINQKKNEDNFSKEFIHYLLKSSHHLKYLLFKEDPPQSLEIYDPDENDENENKERQEMEDSKDNATMAIHNSEEYSKFLEGRLQRIDMDKVWPPQVEGSKNIILVDDEPDVLALLKMNIEDNFPDAKIFEFPTAHQALTELLKINPDLIITDYNLPELNSCEFTYKISERFPNLPIILISGYLDKHIVLSTLSSGASAVIEKPFNSDELTNLIKINLKKYQEFKKFKSALSCLLFQFSDLEDLLREKGLLDILESLRKKNDNLYSYKKFLGTTSNE